MRQFASLCQNCSCLTGATDLRIVVSRPYALLYLFSFLREYCRRQIKTDLTSMTFQSLFQADLNGLKTAYLPILAVCIVTFFCGKHECGVSIVLDFELCSAVWRH